MELGLIRAPCCVLSRRTAMGLWRCHHACHKHDKGHRKSAYKEDRGGTDLRSKFREVEFRLFRLSKWWWWWWCCWCWCFWLWGWRGWNMSSAASQLCAHVGRMNDTWTVTGYLRCHTLQEKIRNCTATCFSMDLWMMYPIYLNGLILERSMLEGQWSHVASSTSGGLLWTTKSKLTDVRKGLVCKMIFTWFREFLTLWVPKTSLHTIWQFEIWFFFQRHESWNISSLFVLEISFLKFLIQNVCQNIMKNWPKKNVFKISRYCNFDQMLKIGVN